jgi:hypothetical protein
MACVLVSTLYAANVLAVVKNWGKRVESESPTPLVFSLPETANLAESYRQFHAMVSRQSLDDQLESATAELWRISFLHRRRIRGLRKCICWLLVSIAALMISGALSVLPVPHF